MTASDPRRPASALDQVPAEQTWRLHRAFPHDAASIYRAFMDPDVLPRWYGPVGWSVSAGSVQLDPRPGGRHHLVLQLDEDPRQSAPLHARHAALVPERLVELHEFLPDPDGRPSEHIIVLRLELEPLDDGTRIRLLQGPLPEEVHATARAAWESSLDRLRALLDGQGS